MNAISFTFVLCISFCVAPDACAQPGLLGSPSAEAYQDTVSSDRYYPLEVGNLWEYSIAETGEFLRSYISSDTLINDVVYFVMTREWLDSNGDVSSPNGRTPAVTRIPIRFDFSISQVVELNNPNRPEEPYRHSLCRLDGDDGELVLCQGDTPGGQTSISISDITISNDILTNRVNKIIYTIFDGSLYVPDIGLVEYASKVDPGQYLNYARVGGRQIGNQRFPVSISGFPDEKPKFFPNPTSDILYVDDLEYDTSIFIYDSVGRIVFAQTITSPQRTRVDTSSFSPGLYWLTIKTSNRAIAASPITVVR